MLRTVELETYSDKWPFASNDRIPHCLPLRHSVERTPFQFQSALVESKLIEIIVMAFGRVSVRYLVSKVIKGSE